MLGLPELLLTEEQKLAMARICDRLWENPPSGENKKIFIIYGPLALYCAKFKAIAFMTPEEQLLERSR